MALPTLNPRILSILDTLHLRVPLRTVVFGTIDFYRKLKIPFIRHTIRRLEARKRAEIRATGRKIKVCILCIDKSQWVFQSVYDAMASDPSFDPYVLVAKRLLRSHGDCQRDGLIEFFRERSVSVRTELDERNLPDVALLPRIDEGAFGDVFVSTRCYRKILCCCQTYAWLIHNCDAAFLGNFEHTYMWKYFTFTFRDLNACKKFSPVHGENAICVGFPRNDEFLHAKPDYTYWKNPRNKKIIWAPHWSVLTHGHFGNFDRYAYPMLNWLKRHPEVDMVLKPHPLLRARLTDPVMIEKLRDNNDNFGTPGTFKTTKEFDSYMAEWNSLPNGSVMNSGGYAGLFSSSDAMILDSGSFLAEYMIFDKPMCFMNRDRTRPELYEKFNEFGRDVLNGLSIADDWFAVEKFFEDLLTGRDDHSAARQNVREKYFNVNAGNVGKSIADYILISLKG